MISIDFNNLAYANAFDYMPSQDPNVSMRVAIPVPNWLRAEGTPKKKYQHPDVVFNADKGEWRFKFINQKDGGREQQVKIDGTGALMIGGMPPHQFKELQRHIILGTKGPDFLTPADFVEIMRWTQSFFRIGDFYNSSVKDVEARFWAYTRPRQNSTFGGFMPRPHGSAAIGYRGPVTFNILASGAQVHKDGGFVTFPTLSAEEVKLAGKAGIAALCAERNITPRTVEGAVFCRQNSLLDGTAIAKPTFKPRFRAKKLANPG